MNLTAGTNRTLKILPALSVLFLITASCNKYIDKSDGQERDIPPVSRSQYKSFSFDLVFSQVIGPRCLECHSTEKKDQPDLTSYSKVMRFVKPGDPFNSDLYLSLAGVTGDMPMKRSPLGVNQRALIKLWIASGAPQSAGQGQEPPDLPDLPPPPVKEVQVKATYSSLNANVFVPYCLECHQPRPSKNKGPAGGLDLTTYESAIASRAEDDDSLIIVPGQPDQSSLVEVMQKGTMPRPNTAPRLSKNVADALAEWIKNGAKND